jgi:hypothetical protein
MVSLHTKRFLVKLLIIELFKGFWDGCLCIGKNIYIQYVLKKERTSFLMKRSLKMLASNLVNA